MAELLGATQVKENRVFKCAFAVVGIMSSLLIYGILQVDQHTHPFQQTLVMYISYDISGCVNETIFVCPFILHK